MKFTVKATYTGYIWVGSVHDEFGNEVGIVYPDGSFNISYYKEQKPVSPKD